MNNNPYNPEIFASLPNEELVDSEWAAAFLKVKKETLAVWRCNRSYYLPYVLIGRLPRYKVGVLRAFVSSNTIGSSNNES